MECFVVNGFQPLTIITKHSILDVVAALDPPLIIWPSIHVGKILSILLSFVFFIWRYYFFASTKWTWVTLSICRHFSTFIWHYFLNFYYSYYLEYLLLQLLFQYCIVLALLLILLLSLLIVNHCFIEFQAWTSQKQIYWDHTGCSPVTLL